VPHPLRTSRCAPCHGLPLGNDLHESTLEGRAGRQVESFLVWVEPTTFAFMTRGMPGFGRQDTVRRRDFESSTNFQSSGSSRCSVHSRNVPLGGRDPAGPNAVGPALSTLSCRLRSQCGPRKDELCRELEHRGVSHRQSIRGGAEIILDIRGRRTVPLALAALVAWGHQEEGSIARSSARRTPGRALTNASIPQLDRRYGRQAPNRT